MYAEVGFYVCFGACVMCIRRSLFNVFPPRSPCSLILHLINVGSQGGGGHLGRK